MLDLEGKEQIMEVDFISPIQNPAISCKKESIVDVLCKDQTGTQIIVEMQVAPTKGFEKRAQYYASKAFVNQLNKGQEADGQYENLKGVIFIAIVDYPIFPNKTDLKSEHVITDKQTHENDLKGLKFIFIALPNLNKNKVADLETVLEKWCYFFNYAEETSEADMAKIAASCKAIGEAYEAVNQFNWSEEQLIAYEDEKKRIADNRSALRYQLDEAKNEGGEEGRKQGKAATNLEVAKKMLTKNYTITEIAALTDLPLHEIEKL